MRFVKPFHNVKGGVVRYQNICFGTMLRDVYAFFLCEHRIIAVFVSVRAAYSRNRNSVYHCSFSVEVVYSTTFKCALIIVISENAENRFMYKLPMHKLPDFINRRLRNIAKQTAAVKFKVFNKLKLASVPSVEVGYREDFYGGFMPHISEKPFDTQKLKINS